MLWSADSRFPLSYKQYDVHSRQGRSQDFPKGATLCQTEGTHQIFMSTSTPRFTYGTKKGLQKGSHGRLRTPPNYALGQMHDLISRYPLSSIQWYVTLHQQERPKKFLWNKGSGCRLTPCRLSRANKRSTLCYQHCPSFFPNYVLKIFSFLNSWPLFQVIFKYRWSPLKLYFLERFGFVSQENK